MEFLLVVGKYVFLALLYLFIFLVYRAVLRDVRGTAPPDSTAARESSSAPGAAMADPSQPARLLAGAEEAPRPSVAMSTRTDGARLVVVQSPDTDRLRLGTEIALSSATALGRSAENTVVLPDRFVSVHHALIYLSQGQHMLRDRDSTNGTHLNGQRVHSDVVLKSGDRLELGRTILEYRQ